MKYRYLYLVAAFIFLAGQVIPVHAQSGVTVTDDRASLVFPNTVTFSAAIKAPTPISLVVLEYGVNQLTCGQVVGKAFPRFTPAEEITVQWTWDMRQSSSEPPGAVIWWRWRVTLQDGSETLSTQQSVTWLDDVHDWKVVGGDNINLHWYDGSQSFGEDLHASAVSALDRLAQQVGITPKQPIDLYIYANADEMQDAVLYEPSWTGGIAYVENSIVIIGISRDEIEWGKLTEAHELTHVLVGHLTFSCLGFLPTWLVEGLGTTGEGGLDKYDQMSLDSAIANDTLMSIQSLSGGFSEEYDRVSLSYAQSYSIVNFLLEAYGKEKMTRLLKVFRDGETADAALLAVYGFDVDGLEDAWRESIGAAPRLTVANPTALPTPTIIPTFIPVSGLSLAATPMPMPTAADGDLPTPSSDGFVTSDASNVDWFSLVAGGLVCCVIMLIVLAVVIFIIIRRRNRSNP